MEGVLQIPGSFIEANTEFSELVALLKAAFGKNELVVPRRSHHDFPNPVTNKDTTLLLMPAWEPGKRAGVKVMSVNPGNSEFDLPAVQGSYLYLDAVTGVLKSIIEAKSLTNKRTAAASALASSLLSREDATTLFMIGTGALSKDLIRAHASVRTISNVLIWGRNPAKAKAVATSLSEENFKTTAIENPEDGFAKADIISCATLSKTPLVLGKYLQPGQHIDLVGAYRPDMREADDETISRSKVFLDTFDSGLRESGDIVIPLQNGILDKEAIGGDLFSLCAARGSTRTSAEEITLFKSVGHALEDLVAASYYHEKFENA